MKTPPLPRGPSETLPKPKLTMSNETLDEVSITKFQKVFFCDFQNSLFYFSSRESCFGGIPLVIKFFIFSSWMPHKKKNNVWVAIMHFPNDISKKQLQNSFFIFMGAIARGILHHPIYISVTTTHTKIARATKIAVGPNAGLTNIICVAI